MNSDDLECFIHVASTGSISRSALALGREQSTVSRHIGRLEAESRAKLFHRSGRGVILTDAGRQLLESAGAVMASLAQTRRVMHSLSARGPTDFVVAAQPTIARTLFPPLSHSLTATYPSMHLRLVEGLGAGILDWLAAGEIDLAVLYRPVNGGSLQVEKVAREQVRLVVPASYRNIGDVFCVRNLGELPLILPSHPNGLRLLAQSLASQAGFSLNIVLECDGSTSLTKRLVEQNCGCTILPLASVSDGVAMGKLRTAVLTDPSVEREVVIATAQNRSRPSDFSQIMRTLRRIIAETVARGDWPGAELV
ncbi:LysR family transcriptional regulator [Xanthobacter autotrophicus DSM 431]|uniref:LysR family transcriptional regulator n=1 Tax=Xanthobacter nonsaccharivorans TaxID=3119912 RepID=UPI0037271D51